MSPDYAGQIFERVSVIDAGAAVGDLDVAPAFEWGEPHEQIGRAVSFILTIAALGLPCRLRRAASSRAARRSARRWREAGCSPLARRASPLAGRSYDHPRRSARRHKPGTSAPASCDDRRREKARATPRDRTSSSRPGPASEKPATYEITPCAPGESQNARGPKNLQK